MFGMKMKRWVNFILMFCILFSGISFDISRADSSVLHAVKTEAHAIDTAEVLSVNRDICTNELIGARTHSAAFMQEARVGGRRISGRTTLIQLAQFALTELSTSMSEKLSERVSVENACNSTVIITYIHNKDGKKA